MKTRDKSKKCNEYLEYKKIVKIVDDAHKKAMDFTKTDFQKKFDQLRGVISVYR